MSQTQEYDGVLRDDLYEMFMKDFFEDFDDASKLRKGTYTGDKSDKGTDAGNDSGTLAGVGVGNSSKGTDAGSKHGDGNGTYSRAKSENSTDAGNDSGTLTGIDVGNSNKGNGAGKHNAGTGAGEYRKGTVSDKSAPEPEHLLEKDMPSSYKRRRITERDFVYLPRRDGSLARRWRWKDPIPDKTTESEDELFIDME